MPVIMTMRVPGEPHKLETVAADNQDELDSIAESAKEHGLIAHRFYGSEDGQIMVIDEWPDTESFQTFFAANRERIAPMLQQAGATSEPEVTFWHKLETHDEVGWGA